MYRWVSDDLLLKKGKGGRSPVQMRSPSESRWPQIAAGRRTAGRVRGSIVRPVPGAPRRFGSQVAMGH